MGWLEARIAGVQRADIHLETALPWTFIGVAP
jgi:hypothetical protein